MKSIESFSGHSALPFCPGLAGIPSRESYLECRVASERREQYSQLQTSFSPPSSGIVYKELVNVLRASHFR